MNVTETGFPGLKLIEPDVFRDSRGYFTESYNKEKLMAAGIHMDVLQDNQSKSTCGVVRGLHYQNEPYAQAKLIRALYGTIYDVVVDIRRGSPSFGKWYGVELSCENFRQLYIPRGFAHGFSVLSPEAIILYKCDGLYNKASEGGINAACPELAIDWHIDLNKAILSEKDAVLPVFSQVNTTFVFN